jgi:hypothetical protein
MVAQSFDDSRWLDQAAIAALAGASFARASQDTLRRATVDHSPFTIIRHSPFAIRFTAFPSFQPVVLRVVGVEGR